MSYQPHQSEDLTLKVGGCYNWRNQPERLVYIGPKRYRGDARTWHQFEKVGEPGKVWSEVLETDLSSIEETRAAPPPVNPPAGADGGGKG